MLDEHDATRLWHRLFRGQQVTTLTLSEAKLLLDDMNPESPLRLRLSAELDEIRSVYAAKKSKKAK